MSVKHAIITGAAGNLGRAITNAFLDAGYFVHAIGSHRDNNGFISRTGLSVYQADLMSEIEAASVLKLIFNETEKVDTCHNDCRRLCSGKFAGSHSNGY